MRSGDSESIKSRAVVLVVVGWLQASIRAWFNLCIWYRDYLSLSLLYPMIDDARGSQSSSWPHPPQCVVFFFTTSLMYAWLDVGANHFSSRSEMGGGTNEEESFDFTRIQVETLSSSSFSSFSLSSTIGWCVSHCVPSHPSTSTSCFSRNWCLLVTIGVPPYHPYYLHVAQQRSDDLNYDIIHIRIIINCCQRYGYAGT
jgi:hypothetical protein